MTTVKYRRILLKLSGEALAGEQGFGIDPQVISGIAAEIKEVVDLGVEVALVIGGGNIFRGLAASSKGMDRASADYMGMLATVMNSLAMQGRPGKAGCRYAGAVSHRECSRSPNPIFGVALFATWRRGGS